ncbi:MAG: hypothetical protein RIE77_02970 [Phycisphaerales bacterium]|jgi:hypothetical protein
MATTQQVTRQQTRTAMAAFLGRSGFGLALAVLLFTALIWLRLRLVTDVPRQAYAAPETKQTQPGSAKSDTARDAR